MRRKGAKDSQYASGLPLTDGITRFPILDFIRSNNVVHMEIDLLFQRKPQIEEHMRELLAKKKTRPAKQASVQTKTKRSTRNARIYQSVSKHSVTSIWGKKRNIIIKHLQLLINQFVFISN